MLGFKSFSNARRVLLGIELLKKLYKRQCRLPASLRLQGCFCLAQHPCRVISSLFPGATEPVLTASISQGRFADFRITRIGYDGSGRRLQQDFATGR